MIYRPGGPHPTGYLRVRILAQMLERMGYPERAYASPGYGTISTMCAAAIASRRHLLRESPRAIPAVVDEIAFQPRRALAEQALASVIPFTRADQALIRRAGLSLRHGRPLPAIPPRFLVCAARYAIEAGADMTQLNKRMLDLLASVPATSAAVLQIPTVSTGSGRMRSAMPDTRRPTNDLGSLDRTPIGSQGGQHDPPEAAHRRSARSGRDRGGTAPDLPQGRTAQDLEALGLPPAPSLRHDDHAPRRS